MQYEQAEAIKLWVNKVGPFNNPQEVRAPATGGVGGLGAVGTHGLLRGSLLTSGAALRSEGRAQATPALEYQLLVHTELTACPWRITPISRPCPPAHVQTYNYYYLPFCKAHPEKRPEHSWGGLGEVGHWLSRPALETRMSGAR